MHPTDGQAHRFPVSIKAVLLVAGRVVLLRNERDEWELPGGKLEAGEEAMACLGREIYEELGIVARPIRILDCWLYDIRGQVEVVIVTYGCRLGHEPDGERLSLSSEHKELGLFAIDEIDRLPMPEGYRRSIRDWRQLERPSGPVA